ncbi:DNA cross-link repair protein PSO2/SNM1 [Conoideocrella luteorostrata]|uniref:DNA cross-link repair protein PSO2/SNM1 n=1 Tax=Conoideocrella luteorostrata TaxID=1105319 RepID=A0AAJ0CW59_9HYPO|nr:DNA cross-link repair protein PSO2/SNM1 [Conoideocrella luteorostrata]
MPVAAKSNRSTTPRKPLATIPLSKKPAKPNASILNFFQKTQRPEESLFVGDIPRTAPNNDNIYSRDDDDDRFNELTSPNKKRKVDEGSATLQESGNSLLAQTRTSPVSDDNNPNKNVKPRLNLPFVIDSDSEDDDGDEDEKQDQNLPKFNESSRQKAEEDDTEIVGHGHSKSDSHNVQHMNLERKLLLESNGTVSAYDQLTEVETFGEIDDLGLDEFEGEEMRERRFMHEQARLEAEEAGAATMEDFGKDSLQDDPAAQSCPVCNGCLGHVSMKEATRHVNSCLDGDPIPIPDPDHEKPAPPQLEVDAAEVSKRFARAAIPRPGQANPFELDNDDNSKKAKSAFSKLMSNKAEDSAWATAAAAENASRGRPAYERTCPFYKIMPGFNICVDAFRYGAVEGCQAYFLSHFHSDHYVGLTANWAHGPVYCSKVTGSLVKQQLRTAAKWVVELEFEKSYDIPATGGATVTMIPANHCPGSSLFLFQKPADKGTNRRGKRILHCGDFRACPAHVTHPLMKPEVKDLVTGKLSQQIIDICYLDTTYLNPKYSFPPQDDVIKACADLCASLSPDPNSKDGLWEKQARQEGTQAVSKYFQSEKQDTDISAVNQPKLGQRLLVVCGTYSIGKERICIAIAKALRTKIFANPAKTKICKQLDDPELTSLLTSKPLEAQVHMQSLMEIRAETLQEYLNGYKPHYSRIVGFRPTGWTYRPPSGKQITVNTSPSSISTQQLLHSKGWKTRFAYDDFVAQRGSTKEAMCFGVPYSEHSSFRELALFIMSLKIEKVIPTVNIGSEQSRKRMKGWLDRWSSERKRGGLARPLIEGRDDQEDQSISLWDDKSGKGGDVWW